MRAVVCLVLGICAAFVTAQTANNAINIPGNGLNVTAGQALTITWTNPSSGTVTIKLQQGGNIQPTDGVVLDSSVAASAGTATFTIPTDVNAAAYSIEIIDDTDPTNYNFSDQFTIAGGSAAATSSASVSASTTGSSSSSSGSSTSSSSGSSTRSASSSASSSGSTTLSTSTSTSASRTASTSTAAQTSATTINGAVPIKVQGGLLAAALALAAALL